jgi:hypothetical protein
MRVVSDGYLILSIGIQQKMSGQNAWQSFHQQKSPASAGSPNFLNFFDFFSSSDSNPTRHSASNDRSMAFF